MFYRLLDKNYADLEDWLAIATSGLSGAAKAQLIEDMTAHYAEAVDALIAEGKSRVDAESQALAQLGEPATVCDLYKRQFEPSAEMKSFFQYYDDMALAKKQGFGPSVRELATVLIGAILLFGTLTSYSRTGNETVPLVAFSILGTAIAATFAGRGANLVSRSHGGLNGYRTLLAMRIVQFLFLGGQGCVLALADSFLILPGAMMSATFAYAAINELRTWRKIRPLIERVSQ